MRRSNSIPWVPCLLLLACGPSAGDGERETDSCVDNRCTDSGASSSGAAPVEIDYQADIQPIWTARCTAGCHEAGGISAFVNLTPPSSHSALTIQKPVYTTDPVFVVPNDSEGSFLMDVFLVPIGTIVRQMPLMRSTDDRGDPVGVAGTPLSDAELSLIVQWIDSGANP